MKLTPFPLISILLILFAVSGCLASNKIVGLKNFGETCYANALFQLLFHNHDFRYSLERYLREQGSHSNKHLIALQNIFDEMDNITEGASVSPDTFKALPEKFERHQQYDVAEVLAFYQSIPDLDWSDFAIQMRELFNLSNLATIEIDLELFLNVPLSGNLNLKDLLDDHFSKKRIEISPSNLVVRIKRLHEADGAKEKITTPIQVQENLSLEPYFMPETKESNPLYRLESFIEHVGSSPNGGHYKFYFKHRDTDEYYAINDESITKISQQVFLERAALAYMYLFRNTQ